MSVFACPGYITETWRKNVVLSVYEDYITVTRGLWKDVPSCKSVNEIQSHFLNFYQITPREQNYQKSSYCSCEQPFSPRSRLVRSFQ